MIKVLLKRLNTNWTVKRLVEEIRNLKQKEPNCFLDGDSKSIAVIK